MYVSIIYFSVFVFNCICVDNEISRRLLVNELHKCFERLENAESSSNGEVVVEDGLIESGRKNDMKKEVIELEDVVEEG